MARYVFPTRDYGTIEIDTTPNTPAIHGLAYFKAQDYEAPISDAGTFADMFGRPFQVILPASGMKDRHAFLQAIEPRSIGRVLPEGGSA